MESPGHGGTGRSDAASASGESPARGALATPRVDAALSPEDGCPPRSGAVEFHSVLFARPEDAARARTAQAPDFFGDLNLDQIVAAITAGKEEYNLAPFFYVPLHDVDAVVFRHEVMRDLEDARVYGGISAFARRMRAVREHLAQLEKRYDEHQKERWFVDAVDLYGDAVTGLVRDLSAAPLRARGLLAFREFLTRYAASEPFTSLAAEAKRLKTELSAIRYRVLIRGPRVDVHHDGGDPDYSSEIEEAFGRFHQGGVHEYTFRFIDTLEMNHIEARILEGVAQLHPATFSALAQCRAAHQNFQDSAIVSFDREIQFYIACLDYIARFARTGLRFCYPRVSDSRKDIYDDQAFDLALAGKLLGGTQTVVTNEFSLTGPERIMVVSGPNQGGKTTMARTVGQVHYLGSIGCLVPGSRAHLYLPDRIFTHFERMERVTNLRGKLQDDLVRIHQILEAATPRSIIIINEIFASAALHDAIYLSKAIAAAVMALDVLCVWVTFIDEVASLGPETVSMVATVVPDNPAERTFKVVRRPADGLAYAMAIAEKYGLTYDRITERLGP